MPPSGRDARTVTLLLVDEDGAVLGALMPFAVRVPFWPEVGDVVAAARAQIGQDVTVLRILATEPGRQLGGAVTYLAQVGAPVAAPMLPAGHAFNLADHPLRAPYARVGGPQRSLRWAAEALDRAGRGPLAAAMQRKTWNLSSIWELATPGGAVWLKQVPPFFAHESAVLAWLAEHGAADQVVALLATDGDGRMLLEHVAGDDLFGAGLAVRLALVANMHAIQVAASGEVDALLAVGVPDCRAWRLAELVRAVVVTHGRGDPGLVALVDGLEDRLATVAACGLPDTLVHGDLHPGNARGDADRFRIIDWGDSSIAHPAFDVLRLCEGLEPEDASHLIARWAAQWRDSVPGCDPLTALDLLRPVAALRHAVVYADFLVNIEPTEHRYHATDVDTWLAQAAKIYASGQSVPS